MLYFFKTKNDIKAKSKYNLKHARECHVSSKHVNRILRTFLPSLLILVILNSKLKLRVNNKTGWTQYKT